VKNKEPLIVKDERNIAAYDKNKKRLGNNGNILRRKCLLKHVIEEKMEETRIWGRRRKQLVNDLKKR
jgi:hypothetical protein